RSGSAVWISIWSLGSGTSSIPCGTCASVWRGIVLKESRTRSASARNGSISRTARGRCTNLTRMSPLPRAGTVNSTSILRTRRMDAALMEGRRLQAGAVAGIEQVRHPISAARLVLDKTPHVLIAGPSATRLARHFKLDRQAPPTPAQRRKSGAVAQAIGRQRQTVKVFAQMSREETVGAVALDLQGDVAAGASTGGIAFMLPGRVGDTPLI